MKKAIILELIAFNFIVSCKHTNVVENEIPFIYDGFINVNCTMSDTIHGNFCFDTGAYDFTIDSTFEREKIRNPFFSVDSLQPALINNFMRIRVDSLNFFPEFVGRANCKRPWGRFADGIIGWNLFKNKVIEIDYINEKMRVFDPDKFTIEDDFQCIPLDFIDGKIYLKAELKLKEGSLIEGKYMFDLGFGGAIQLFDRVARPYKLDLIIKDQEKFLVYNTTLYSDRSEGGIFRAASLKIGSIAMKEPIIRYYNNNVFKEDSCDFLGLIGNEFFEKFRVFIDFRKGMLYLKPNVKFNERMMYTNIGFVTVNRTDVNEGATVKGVSLNSDADKAGIRLGDMVTHINGTSVKTFTLGQKIFEDKSKDYEFTMKRKDSVFKFKTKPIVK
ncbi:MAG: PDZ domain-containing protein [Bacteroidia bacterium]|nr:PDZ domain-containing protein [Bacteroidia bacterium]